MLDQLIPTPRMIETDRRLLLGVKERVEREARYASCDGSADAPHFAVSHDVAT